MAKYFLVTLDKKDVNIRTLTIASKRYGHGDPVSVSDGVAGCDLIRRFLKEGFIEKLTEKEYKALMAPPKKTPAPRAEVKEPKAPKVEKEKPEPEPEAPKVEEKPKRTRRGGRKKKSEDK
jgi:hypothetical protein